MTDTASNALVNTGATQSLTIKMAVADPALTGVADPGSDIVYTIDVLPAHGTLTVNGVAVADGGQLTQDQLDQGLVVYTDDGSGAGSDLFSYSISDTLLNHNLGSGSFDTQHIGGTLGVNGNIFFDSFDPVIFFSEAGNNSIGGPNTTVSYALAPAGVFITLPNGGSNGFGGSDLLSAQTLIGSSHDDMFFSDSGTSLIFGGGGNDEILGAGGTVTAGFSGARSDYLVVAVNADEVKITDLRPNSPDGTDDDVSVHSFQFSDGTYSFAQLGALNEIENSGSTILGPIGDNYFLHASGTAGEPELKDQGSPISVSGFASIAIGAEQVAGGGYDVAWETFGNPSGTPTYMVWSVDSNGNYVSTLVGPVVASDQALEALETTFSQDLNSDGITGIPNVTAIETFGSTELGQASNFYYMDPVAGGTGPELKYGGIPFVAAAWTPIGAEQTSTGYEVALFNASSNLYTIWNTDSSGNVLSASLAGVSGTNTALESIEVSFHQDLNGDGTIGIPGVIETFGATQLAEVGNNYFFDPVAGGTGPELQYGGTPFVAAAWAPIGVEKTSTGFEVALFNASSDLYTVWNTDSSGNVLSASLAGVSGTNTALESIEVNFHQDLNGDNSIGIPGVIETFGATELMVVGNHYFFNPVAGGTGPELTYGGTPFVATTWAPTGVEKMSGGYEVALFNASSHLYTVWDTDSSGNVLSTSLAGVSGTSTALESIEVSFHQDLNGDGTIGIPGVIEAFGATELVQVGNDYFLNPTAGGIGPELTYGGTPFVAAAWAPIGAEHTSTGYEVALFNASSDLYTVWNTGSDGNVLSASLSGVSGTSTALESIETSFQQDLNGDGTVGIPGQSSTAEVSKPATAATVTTAPITAPSSGNAVLSGSAASDTFVFNAQFGNNTVKGFQPGVDQVALDHTLVASVADLFSHTADNAVDSAVVTVGADQSITFDEVSKLVLQHHASDFHLV
jgi:hypothetical protein